MAIKPEQERRVAEFIHGVRLDDLPTAVIRQARRCMIDLLACSLAGIPSKTGQATREFATAFGGREECSLFGGGMRKVPLPLAALANTTICEALDGDDGYNLIKGHPGAFLFPVLLAFAERDRLSGRQALETLVAGYEVGMRAGLISHAVNPAYHGSGSWGGVGSAAVAARCLHLNVTETGHALGAAAYHGTMAPIMRCVQFPGMTKDGIGWSAFAGVSAALLAQCGFTSCPGLFALEQASELAASLGAEFLIRDLYFKPYCCCRWAHAPVRAALQARRDNLIDPRCIERIVVETFSEACQLSRAVPGSSEEAQYSVAYPVAAALVHGDVGPEQVLEGGYSDSRVISLMSVIDFRHRQDFQAEFPARRLA
jgi:2-methylcitrate dehydratase PrpD